MNDLNCAKRIWTVIIRFKRHKIVLLTCDDDYTKIIRAPRAK